MTLKEFLNEINGIDTNTKKPKSVVTFRLEMLNIVTNKTAIIESFSIHLPVVNIERRGDYIEFKMTFKTAKDPNLRRIWNMYEHYGRLMNNKTDDSKNIPNIFAMAVPTKHEGKMFLYAQQPIFWVPKPKAPGLDNNILSIMFDVNSVNFVDNFAIDTATIKAEAERDFKRETDIES